jgi:hypothetical protein
MAVTPLVLATDYIGADLGAKINAADADLGGAPGIIVVPPGTYTLSTPLALTADRTLLFSVGSYTGLDDALAGMTFAGELHVLGERLDAKTYARDGSIETSVLVKRGSTAGSVAQLATTDTAVDVIGACITTSGSRALISDQVGAVALVKSDGTETIPIGASVTPSPSSAGRIRVGGPSIGYNYGTAVTATPDALCEVL